MVMKLQDRELGKIKERNVGKWIAVKEGKVVSLSEDFHELMKELGSKKIREGIYVFYSPKPEEKEYGFLFLVV
jgi:hypothetical protein